MSSPELPQRIPDGLGVPGPFPPLQVDVVCAVTAGLRAWALSEAERSSGCRGVQPSGTGKFHRQGSQ
ncbi:hypothetical protein [Nocardia australiensis]|uniref:hypothetical protein n=1 Tax=Nocardia australiensis TaxID=2887191 RepID=UPI001D137380|nr:hypothetical protein [Nocardia australiensis]